MFTISSKTFQGGPIVVKITEFVNPNKDLKNVRKFMGLLEEKIPRNPTRTYNQTTNESTDPSQNKRDTAAGYYQGAPPGGPYLYYPQSTIDSQDAKPTIYSEPAQSNTHCSKGPQPFNEYYQSSRFNTEYAKGLQRTTECTEDPASSSQRPQGSVSSSGQTQYHHLSWPISQSFICRQCQGTNYITCFYCQGRGRTPCSQCSNIERSNESRGLDECDDLFGDNQ